MNRYIAFLVLSTMLIICSRAAFAQESIEECVEFDGDLPCGLLVYPTLVDPASLPVAPVAVAIHIVRYGNGSGGFQGSLSTIINTFNSKFAGARLNFFQVSLDYIDSDYFASQNPPYTAAKEDELSAAYNVENTVNIYFIRDYYRGTAAAVGTFTPDVMESLDREEQSIIINNTNASQGNSIYHEMGHYFNLLHTFEISCGNPDPTNCLSSPVGQEIRQVIWLMTLYRTLNPVYIGPVVNTLDRPFGAPLGRI
ncbi:MAG: M43 family zinc metalloprotease [Bacteroidota bacterium]